MSAREIQPELSVHLPGKADPIIAFRGGWSHAKDQVKDTSVLDLAFANEMLTRGLENTPSGLTITVVEPMYSVVC